MIERNSILPPKKKALNGLKVDNAIQGDEKKSKVLKKISILLMSPPNYNEFKIQRPQKRKKTIFIGKQRKITSVIL
jgi:hypothetical protein